MQADVLKKQRYPYGSKDDTGGKTSAFFKSMADVSENQRLLLYALSSGIGESGL